MRPLTDAAGRLPLLAPMSEVAGRMAVQAGARCLEQCGGGSGVLLGGVPGVEPARVVIPGAGVAGSHALAMAAGLGADVTVIDRDLARLKALDAYYAGRVRTVFSTKNAIERHVLDGDLVIGTVLVPGAAAPKLITREMVAAMRQGSAIVDVAVDQGAAARPPGRPATRRRRFWRVAWCTIASRTCRAGSRHLHLRAEQRDPALRHWPSPTRAGAVRSPTTRTSGTA